MGWWLSGLSRVYLGFRSLDRGYDGSRQGDVARRMEPALLWKVDETNGIDHETTRNWRRKCRPNQTRPPSPTLISETRTNIQRIAYVYKAKREINGSRVRVIWGRISRPHGNNGAVKSKFTSNLPAKTFGASCRIVRHSLSLLSKRLTIQMLFPSNI